MNTPRASRFLKTAVLLSALLWADGRVLPAADLFSVSVAPGGTVVGGNQVLTLVDKIINGKDEFAFFQGPGVAYVGTLQYGNVQNAMNFSINAARTSADLNIPSIGYTQTFVGANQADLETQIEHFLKKDGSSVLARFLKAMNAQSLVAVSDGNPNSTTAFAAGQSYQNYGMSFAETKEEKDSPKESTGRFGLGIIADVGTFDANGIKGTTFSLPLFARFKLTDRVGLNFDMPLSYVDVEGATILASASASACR